MYDYTKPAKDLTILDLLEFHKDEIDANAKKYQASRLMGKSPIVLDDYKNKVIFHDAASKILQSFISSQGEVN